MKGAIPRDLGDGLLLRRATPADGDALAAFNADLHHPPGAEPNAAIGAWTRDLLDGRHPTTGPGDFTIVEDTATGTIVSSLCLISQTWSYDGIAFGIGRPELVGTHRDYRNRGLVRLQMAVVHAWSAERGELAQAITGIPWYYRQFGYEMAITLGGSRSGSPLAAPSLPEGTEEPFQVRPAEAGDLPFIARAYEAGTRRRLVDCVRDEAQWRYELSGRGRETEPEMLRELRLIARPGGEPVGFLAHPPILWGRGLPVVAYELAPGVSWLSPSPSVLRYLRATGEARAARGGKEFGRIMLHLGTEHPAYEALAGLLPTIDPPYAWYIRVPDLPAFVRRIAPALERRLATSSLVGHTGEVKISFYRSGLRLAFAEGRLTAAEAWRPTPDDGGDTGFPELTFLQLLFGYRALAELRYAFADCWTWGDESRALLEALFPKRASNVWPLG